MQLINDDFHGASFETKVSILRDEYLLGKIKKAETIVEQRELIESFISTQNSELAATLQEKERILDEKGKELSQEREAKNQLTALYESEIEKTKQLQEKINELSKINKDEKKEESIQPISNKNKSIMDKKIILILIGAFLALALLLLVCNRQGKVKIGKDGAEFETGKANEVNTLKKTEINNLKFLVTGKLTINLKTPPPKLISGIGIKGDTDVPESTLNGEAFSLENVTLPPHKQVVFAFKLNSGEFKYIQFPITKIDSVNRVLYPSLINFDIPENKIKRRTSVKASDVNVTLIGSDGNIIKIN